MVLRGIVSLLALVALAYVGSQASSHARAGGSMSLAAGQALSLELDQPEPQSRKQKPRRKPKKGSPRRSAALTADGRVILNLAAATDLRKLPGIGAKRAVAILKLRDRLGKFRRVKDLLRIRGIGFRLLKRIKPLVVIDPPPKKPAKKPPKK